MHNAISVSILVLFKTCLIWRGEIPLNKIGLFATSYDAPGLKSAFWYVQKCIML